MVTIGLLYSQDGAGMSIVRSLPLVPHDSAGEERWWSEGLELAYV